MASAIRLVTERTGAGQPILDNENGEELMHVEPGVTIVLGNTRPPESLGTLYITTKQIVWLSDSDRTKGYAVDFISMALHAVSRDRRAYPSPNIFIRIDAVTAEDGLEESDSESDATLNLSKITLMRFVPSDLNHLSMLFAIFCECAELNPDPVEEEEGEHSSILSADSSILSADSSILSADQMEYDAAEDNDSDWGIAQNPTHTIGANGYLDNPTHTIGANGSLDLAQSVGQLQINDRRFEDAEEMEHDCVNGHI